MLKNRQCLIVGAGRVAARKAERLLAAEADVTVVAPAAVQIIKDLAAAGKITLHLRPFVEKDLAGVFLVYLATGDHELNRNILEQAQRRGILACAVDKNWQFSTFITPAAVNSAEITIAISSQGVSCRKTKLIRENISRHIETIASIELLVMGTDHNLLDIAEREPIHLRGRRLDHAGELIMKLWGIQGFILLNTCNRLELIAVAHADEPTLELLRTILNLERCPAEHYYVKTGFDAFRHLCLTAAGLLSQTPGENHITAQLKAACQYGVDKGWTGALLKSLINNVLHLSRQLRNATAPVLKIFEIEAVACKYIESQVPCLDGLCAVIAGTGNVGSGVMRILAAAGCRVEFLFHSRLPDEDVPNVRVAPLSTLQTLLAGADIIVTALACDAPVITAEMLAELKPATVVVDLGIPRNVAHPPDAVRHVRLIDLEDLKYWHRRNNCEMEAILRLAEEILTEHKDDYDKFKNSYIDGHQSQ